MTEVYDAILITSRGPEKVKLKIEYDKEEKQHYVKILKRKLFAEKVIDEFIAPENVFDYLNNNTFIIKRVGLNHYQFIKVSQEEEVKKLNIYPVDLYAHILKTTYIKLLKGLRMYLEKAGVMRLQTLALIFIFIGAAIFLFLGFYAIQNLMPRQELSKLADTLEKLTNMLQNGTITISPSPPPR